LWENIHKPGNFEGVRDEHCASLQSLHWSQLQPVWQLLQIIQK
jgi:hypothetical protein